MRTLLFAACIFLVGALGDLVYRNLAEPPPAERPSAACLGAIYDPAIENGARTRTMGNDLAERGAADGPGVEGPDAMGDDRLIDDLIDVLDDEQFDGVVAELSDEMFNAALDRLDDIVRRLEEPA